MLIKIIHAIDNRHIIFHSSNLPLKYQVKDKRQAANVSQINLALNFEMSSFFGSDFGKKEMVI